MARESIAKFNVILSPIITAQNIPIHLCILIKLENSYQMMLLSIFKGEIYIQQQQQI
jgi:hypothetical protein